MKSIFTLFVCFGLTLQAMAQAPQKFNYQGIARDVQGNPMSKQQLSIKLSVLPTQDATVPEYEETQWVNTNEFGLYTLQIGAGTPITGEMKTVKWEAGNKYIRVAIDPKGGQDFMDAGTTQLLSVPYALYADKAGEARESVGSSHQTTRASNNFIEKTSATGVANSNSLLFDNGTNIGLNTTSPLARFHVNGTTGNTTEIRLQHAATSGSSRFAFFADNGTSFTTTNDYAVMNKYTAGTAGTLTPGFPIRSLYAFSNSKGSLFFTSAANVGFGQWNPVTNTYSTRLFLDSATGFVGLGTVTPGARLDVSGGNWDLSNTEGDVRIGNSTNSLRIGVATGGGGAGHVTMAARGTSANLLSLGTGNTYPNLRTLNVTNGRVGIGTINPERTFEVQPGSLSAGTDSGAATFYNYASFSSAIHAVSNSTGLSGPSTVFARALIGGWQQNTPVGSANFGVWGHQTGQGIGGWGGLFSNGATMNNATKYVALSGNDDRAAIFMGGKVGIGTATPASPLHVVSTAADTALLVECNTGSLQQTGVYGRYNTAGYGAGVFGRAFGGITTVPSTRDIGVLGASGDIAVWSAGKLKVVDGTEGAGKVLVSDATGTASWRNNIGFTANTTSGTINAGASFQLTYGVESFDDGNAYNPANGEFIAPVAGVYQFNYSVTFNPLSAAPSGSPYVRIGLLRNGSFEPGTINSVSPPSNGFWGISHSSTVKLNAGDVVRVQIGNFSGTAISVYNNALWGGFSGHLVY